MHITLNRASNKIRNVSLARGSVSSLCRLEWQTVLRCRLTLSPLPGPSQCADACQLAVSLSLVSPGWGCDHIQLRSRISKPAWPPITEAT